MKKIFLLALAALLLCLPLAACQTQADLEYALLQQEVDQNPTPEELRPDLDPANGAKPQVYSVVEPMLTPAPDDNLRGELTIQLGYWGDNGTASRVQELAEEFQQLHPMVKFNYIYPEDHMVAHNYTAEERRQRAQQLKEKISTEIMCRKADYIIFDNPFSNLLGSFYQMAMNGMFLDMKPYFEEDPDMDPDDYYTEAIDALSVDGAWAMMPFSFSYDAVYLNRSVLEELGVDSEEIQEVTTTQILDWYEQALTLEPDLQLFFGAPGKDNLFLVERAAFTDLEHFSASFDSPEFVSFLERSHSVINYDEDPGWNFGAGADEILRWQDTGREPERILYDKRWPHLDPMYLGVTQGRRSFVALEDVEMTSAGNLDQPLEYMAGPYPLLASDGKLGSGFGYGERFVVPACHPNPQLAWEFIKYCMMERDNMEFNNPYWYSNRGYTEYLPIHKKNLRGMVEYLPMFVQTLNCVGYPYFDPVDVDKVVGEIERVLGSYELVNSRVYSLDMDDYLDEYFVQELITAEECAKKIQGRTDIWLNE